jgi:hypothetical protein
LGNEPDLETLKNDDLPARNEEVFMKATMIGLVCMLTLGGSSAEKGLRLSVRNTDLFRREFTGEIMDSFCAEDGHHIGVNKSEMGLSKAGCTLTCVKLGGAQFVLHDPRTGSTYKLDDQRKPEPFAGQLATVLGAYDKETKTIHVTEIRPVIVSAF